jgi:hypothetical protein
MRGHAGARLPRHPRRGVLVLGVLDERALTRLGLPALRVERPTNRGRRRFRVVASRKKVLLGRNGASLFRLLGPRPARVGFGGGSSAADRRRHRVGAPGGPARRGSRGRYLVVAGTRRSLRGQWLGGRGARPAPWRRAPSGSAPAPRVPPAGLRARRGRRSASGEPFGQAPPRRDAKPASGGLRRRSKRTATIGADSVRRSPLRGRLHPPLPWVPRTSVNFSPGGAWRPGKSRRRRRAVARAAS